MRPFKIRRDPDGFTVWYRGALMKLDRYIFYPSIGDAMDAICNYLRALK